MAVQRPSRGVGRRPRTLDPKRKFVMGRFRAAKVSLFSLDLGALISPLQHVIATVELD
jgi:hypothetical protein